MIVSLHSGRSFFVTGAAGFIGSHAAIRLLERGDHVVGLDNFNDYYDPARKRANLADVQRVAQEVGTLTFVEGDIRDRPLLAELFQKHAFTGVAHLAAMAGVRPSVDNPWLYYECNLPMREHTKLSEKEIKQQVTEKLNTLGLENVEKRFPSQLSGGMRKRVALARALMLEPEIIMYDEPTSGLDPVTSRIVDELIVDTRKKFGVTSVIISHDMVGALQIADKIYLLSKGSIVASGSPQELIHGSNEYCTNSWNRAA
jgi:ABC-type dipeptide/oligopeptide/nickel transport system ATPase component